MSKIKQLAIDHYLKILIPFILMWAIFVTKGALTGSNIADLKTTMAKQNEVHHMLRSKVEDELKLEIGNKVLELKKDIHEKNEEVRELRRLIMNLWQVQGEMERECGKNLQNK
jgi:ribosomal protein S13